MSGYILFGIAAVGTGWVLLHRHTPVALTPQQQQAVGGGPVGGPLPPVARPTVGDTTTQATEGLTGIVGAVTQGGPAGTGTIGDPAVGGSDGGQVIPGEMRTADGIPGVVIDSAKSVGGADPSTLGTYLHTGDRDPIPPPSGDTLALVLQATSGLSGGAGLTRQQLGRAYAESAIWSNVVF